MPKPSLPSLSVPRSTFSTNYEDAYHHLPHTTPLPRLRHRSCLQKTIPSSPLSIRHRKGNATSTTPVPSRAPGADCMSAKSVPARFTLALARTRSPSPPPPFDAIFPAAPKPVDTFLNIFISSHFKYFQPIILTDSTLSHLQMVSLRQGYATPTRHL